MEATTAQIDETTDMTDENEGKTEVELTVRRVRHEVHYTTVRFFVNLGDDEPLEDAVAKLEDELCDLTADSEWAEEDSEYEVEYEVHDVAELDEDGEVVERVGFAEAEPVEAQSTEDGPIDPPSDGPIEPPQS